MSQLSFFEDEPSGEERRDEGIAKVIANNPTWIEDAVVAFQNHVKLVEFAGEDVRQVITPIIGYPHHPNAWGALAKELLRRKLIVPTGRSRKMRIKTSNARTNPIYRYAASH